MIIHSLSLHSKENYNYQNGEQKTMDSFIKIGDIIKHYRMEKGLSQDELAEGICSRKYISQLETHQNIPTLFIINALSARLGINLYDSYAIMLQHHDMETHKKIVCLNEALAEANFDKIRSLVDAYQTLPEFQHGEPMQFLKYGECVYYSNVLQEHAKAISIAKSAFSNPPLSLLPTTQNTSFSNIELTLLNFIAVNTCRLGNLNEGKEYFNFLYSYLDQLFIQNHYIANRNNHFELRFFANLVYNDFCFFHETADFNTKKIDTVLELLKSLHSHFDLPELLLCKVSLHLEQNQISEAKQLYPLAHELGLYLYSKEEMTELEKRILPYIP